MGSNQYDRYYLDDDWYQDIKLDASIPISSGEDLISTASFHATNNGKSSKKYNNTSQQHTNNNQNNGNAVTIPPKCLNNAKNKDSDANIDFLLGDDNDNPASYTIYAPIENKVRMWHL